MRRLSICSGLIASLLVAIVAGGRPSGAGAQDATAVAFPITPDPAACQHAPRSTDELIALWYGPEGSPVAETAAAVGVSETGITIPVGTPADRATVEAVVATVIGVFACSAAGDFPRATALFTDDFVRGFAPGPDESEAETRAFLDAPPVPEAPDAVSPILAIAEVTVLADGRVGAFVVTQRAAHTDVAYAVLARQDDRWLLDGVTDFGV